MTQSELLTVMSRAGATSAPGSWAPTSSSAGVEPRFLLATMLMTAPGSILLAKILMPGDRDAGDGGDGEARGRAHGREPGRGGGARRPPKACSLALNVGAMLIAFLALIALLNVDPGPDGSDPGDDPRLRVRAGGPGHGRAGEDAMAVGSLLGLRMVANEFIAYSSLGPMKAAVGSALLRHRHLRPLRLRELLVHRHPDRRHRRPGSGAAERPRRLGLRALVAGTLAAFMSACFAGMLL